MTYPIIETHAHLDMTHYDSDRIEVLARAKNAGVFRTITIGIDMESSCKAIELAETHPEVFATVGFHPHEADRVTKADIANLSEIANKPKVVAIGETGLDYYRNRSSRQAQLQALQWQLKLAEKLDLPVVIHCRQAEKDMLPILKEWTSSRRDSSHPIGVIHCFNGDREAANQYLAMGFNIALGAYIGYPSSVSLRDTIKNIPQNRLVLETDSPFLPPQSYRGKRNEPSYLPLVLKSLSAIMKVEPDSIAINTTRNACNLFRLPESRLTAGVPV
ncbi:TatD family hydrolase [Chloroflexota bacterium]